MKPIGEAAKAAQKAAKHRKFHWCRRQNGFSDMPIWRVVAAKAAVPLACVLAFVNRLEELGNEAGNAGLQRGSLEQFSPDEFAAALGISAEEAARVYATLEAPGVGWISFDHIADFHDRNPDQEESAEDVRDRKRRQRSRDACRRHLARLAAQGKISARDRLKIEVTLRGISDDALVLLQNRLAAAELSTSHAGHNVTDGDIVTVTADQTTEVVEAVVDNSGDGAGGESEGLAKEGQVSEIERDATRWVDTEGCRMLVEYLQIKTGLAQTYIERWRRDLQDDVTLQAIMMGADQVGHIGPRFHAIVTDQLRRHVALKQHGAPLPLMPPRPGAARSAAESHDVTVPAVDNAKRSAS